MLTCTLSRMCDWAINMASDMQDNSSSNDVEVMLGRAQFPGIHGWAQRFRTVADEAQAKNAGAGPLEEGQEAEDEVVRKILSSTLTEKTDLWIDESDALVKMDGLKVGQRVSVGAADIGGEHKDVGTLLRLAEDEVVIEVEVPNGEGNLRLHFPRINCKILPA